MKRLEWTACAILLSVHAVLLAWGAYCHSPAIDEWGHLPAGLMHWREGRFDAYRVNPPLVRMVATLPLLPCIPQDNRVVPPASGSYRSEVLGGVHLYFAHGAAAFRFFILARLACIPFSLIGACVCYRWAHDLYGRTAAMVAMTLWCLSPNVLAYSQTILPDAPAAAIGLAANYAFWKWLCGPTWSRTILVGLLLGLALLTKTTWLLLLVLWPLVWLAARWTRRGDAAPLLREAVRFAAILLIATYLVNAVFEFQGSCTRLGDYQFVSKALRGPEESTERAYEASVGNGFAGTWLGACPVPFPRDYVLGIDRQKLDFEGGMWSYLRGEWRLGGWWYYYLYAMAIKIPLGTWALVLLAALMSLTAAGRRAWRTEVYLLIPALAVLALVSSQTGFNHHIRYVLPAFPYLFILASKPFAASTGRRRPLFLPACVLLAWSVGSSLMIYPHSMSYFNESVGGPRGGHAHLVSSNIDFAQDLIYLREWLERHPEAAIQGIALFCDLPSAIVALEAPGPPAEPQPGWYVVSVDRIRQTAPDGRPYFLRFKPLAMAGYSIYIYHITPDDANRVRREMGLAELHALHLAPTLQTCDPAPPRGSPGRRPGSALSLSPRRRYNGGMTDRILTALPVYNELRHVTPVLDEATCYSPEVLVVDDGSTDGTGELLRGRGDVHLIRHERNRGYGAALVTAFEFALCGGYDVLVTIDCDGQHQPQRIPQFVRTCVELEADVVSGSRYLESFAGDSLPPENRRQINRLITDELNRRLELRLTDAFCGFKAYRVPILAKLEITETGYAMPLELWVQAADLGLKIVELPVPLIYLEEARSFGGSLDNAAIRLGVYREVLERAMARTKRWAGPIPAGSAGRENVR